MPVERRGQAIDIGSGQPGSGQTDSGRNSMFNGRRQPSHGGTSRMMREYQVRICERLGVQFLGPTRQWRRFERTLRMSGLPSTATEFLRYGNRREGPLPDSWSAANRHLYSITSSDAYGDRGPIARNA